MNDLTEKKALLKLANYCSKAERCEFDIRRKLELWNINEPTVISSILKQLYLENFLNQERYCRAYIKDKILYNKWGVNKILYELKKKNIPEREISQCLESFSYDLFEQQLTKILNTKLKSIKYKDNYELKNKLIRFALSRGYNYDLIKKCISNII